MKPFEKEVIKMMQNKIIIGFMHIHIGMHLQTYYRALTCEYTFQTFNSLISALFTLCILTYF